MGYLRPGVASSQGRRTPMADRGRIYRGPMAYRGRIYGSPMRRNSEDIAWVLLNPWVAYALSNSNFLELFHQRQLSGDPLYCPMKRTLRAFPKA
jgi:hypothetical protein